MHTHTKIQLNTKAHTHNDTVEYKCTHTQRHLIVKFAITRGKFIRASFLCVCMNLFHACLYVCMYTCMHACMHACMCVLCVVCVGVCVCMYICACMHTYPIIRSPINKGAGAALIAKFAGIRCKLRRRFGTSLTATQLHMVSYMSVYYYVVATIAGSKP